MPKLCWSRYCVTGEFVVRGMLGRDAGNSVLVSIYLYTLYFVSMVDSYANLHRQNDEKLKLSIERCSKCPRNEYRLH